MTEIHLRDKVPMELAGGRLDQVAARMFPDYSRSLIQEWIRSGALVIDGVQQKPRYKLSGSELIEINAMLEEQGDWQPQQIGLDIRYEDEDLLVLNKPAGLVVHPAAGHPDGTLVNALLYHAPDLATLPRAGIVHRLDKDTTGLLVVAKSIRAHKGLIEQLQARQMGREYEAVVMGVMTGGGSVDEPIGRHPRQRKKMAVSSSGKDALTHYGIIKRFRAHTHLKLRLESGRTHQIRVHMAHLRYPIVGDQTYGGRLQLPRGADVELVEFLRTFPRQALHARRLQLQHPVSGEQLQWEVEIPADMQTLINLLEKDQHLLGGLL